MVRFLKMKKNDLYFSHPLYYEINWWLETTDTPDEHYNELTATRTALIVGYSYNKKEEILTWFILFFDCSDKIHVHFQTRNGIKINSWLSCAPRYSQNTRITTRLTIQSFWRIVITFYCKKLSFPSIKN